MSIFKKGFAHLIFLFSFTADLEKAKENNSSQQGSSSSEGAIDLSSHKRAPPPIVGGLNLKKESALLKAAAPPPTPPSHHHQHHLGSSSSATPSLDLTLKSSSKNEVKVSPFSAEALLSKSSSSSTNFHRPSEPSRMAAPPPKTATPPRTSPYPHASRASPLFSPSASQPSGGDKARSSPWHTPVNASSSSRPHGASGSSAKPAIPVSPVVREDKNKDLSFQAALLGLGAASASMPPVSLPLPPTTYGSLQASLAANPYLAMAAAGLPKTSTSAAAAAAASSAAFPSPMMDPTSAYYAALYSQSLYGLSNPYAAAAGMRLPGMPPSTPAAPPHPPNPAAAAASAGAAASMDLLALQAMMSRGSSSSAAAAAAANPYAAAAAAGYPPGLSGLFGLPGYPPGAPSGRKDP